MPPTVPGPVIISVDIFLPFQYKRHAASLKRKSPHHIILRYTYSLEERSGQASAILEWRVSDRVRFFNINTAAVGGGKETEFNSLLAKSVLAGIEVHF